MNEKKFYNPIFLVPAFFIYTVMFTIPAFAGLAYSFTDWNTYRTGIKFIGLDNYIEIFASSSSYLTAIINTAEFTVITVVLKCFLGLFLALLLNEKIRTKNLLRTIFFAPYTLSPLIIGIVFIAILKPDGPFNSIINLFGFGKFTLAWLVEPETALLSTMGVEIWRMVGFNMAIFLAGLQMIPKEYYEAASIDGASTWSQFKSITIPFLAPSINITVILNIIHGVRVFDIIFALTGGGPGQLTEVINTQVFREFSNGRYGMSNALSFIAMLFTLIIAIFMKNILKGKE